MTTAALLLAAATAAGEPFQGRPPSVRSAQRGGPVLRWEPLGEPGCGGWITGIAVSPEDPRRVLLGGDILGAGLSTDGGETWGPATGFASWEMAEFTFVDKTLWAGTMSGPYRSRDGGRTWEARRAGLPPASDVAYSAPVEVVLPDPARAGRLLAFGGSHRRYPSPGQPAWGAVWESLDGGARWTKLATIAGGRNVLTAAFAPGRSGVAYAAVDGAGVWRTSDGGRGWVPANGRLPHGGVHWIAVHPRDGNVLWAALGNRKPRNAAAYEPGGIWKSLDGGANWTLVSRGLGQAAGPDADRASRYECVVVAPSDPGVLYTADTAWGGAAIYRSRDGGESWARVLDADTKSRVATPWASGPGMTILAVAPTDARLVFAGGSEYLLRSRDGGDSWEDVTSRPAGDGAWRGRGFSGLVATGFAFDPANPRHAVLLGMDDGKLWQSFDGMKSWRWGGRGLEHWGGAAGVALGGSAGATLYAALGQSGEFGGVAKSSDAGRTWIVAAGPEHGLPARGARATAGDALCLPDQPEIAWVLAGGTLYRTSDGGASWLPAGGVAGLTSLAADPANPQRFFAGGPEGVYLCTDGLSLQPMPDSPPLADRLVFAPGPGFTLYGTRWRKAPGGLFRNAGRTWGPVRADPFIADVAVDPSDGRRLAVVTNDHPYHDRSFATGVWVSWDAGRNWIQANEGLPVLRGSVIRFNPHDPEQLVVGTLGRGFFTARWPRITSSSGAAP